MISCKQNQQGMMISEIEQLLGVPFPVNMVKNVHYQKVQPEDYLHYHYVFAALEIPEADYLQLIDRDSFWRYKEDDEAFKYLPAAWSPEEASDLAWWNPTAETPLNSAAQKYGKGWLILKYENGRMFVLATDH
jgi:hypothetical protein